MRLARIHWFSNVYIQTREGPVHQQNQSYFIEKEMKMSTWALLAFIASLSSIEKLERLLDRRQARASLSKVVHKREEGVAPTYRTFCGKHYETAILKPMMQSKATYRRFASVHYFSIVYGESQGVLRQKEGQSFSDKVVKRREVGGAPT